LWLILFFYDCVIDKIKRLSSYNIKYNVNNVYAFLSFCRSEQVVVVDGIYVVNVVSFC